MKKIVEIIKAINAEGSYWSEKTRMVKAPKPNMSVYTGPDEIPHTEDVISPERFPDEIVDFLLEVSVKFSHLALYVHQGPFLMYPVFGIRHLDKKQNSPYLIKFKKSNLSQERYDKLILLLYSKHNFRKHRKFNLKRLEQLSHYEY